MKATRIQPFLTTVLCSFGLLLFAAPLMADIPTLVFKGNIQDGSGALKETNYSNPFVVDWNNDGTFELLIGESIGQVRHFDGRGPLYATTNTLSAATGGTVQYTLDAGAGNTDRFYAMFASVSGTSPGIPLYQDVVLPINWDLFTEILISLYGTAVCTGFSGNLNASGQGTAILDTLTPLPPDSAGTVMSFAFCLWDPPRDFASNGLNILIVP